MKENEFKMIKAEIEIGLKSKKSNKTISEIIKEIDDYKNKNLKNKH